MVRIHPLAAAVGIEQYVSETPGIGGTLRDRPEDFRVRERERFSTEPVSADPDAYPYLIVRVTLRDWETNTFAGTLADRLGISRQRIDWAGTKDKRAITTQLFSIKGIEPATLPSISDVEYEVVGRAGRALAFGDLAGNEFTITVRNATAPDRIDAITEELRSFGNGTVSVPNYFGQQRFGSRRPITHTVGLAIVAEDWETAVRRYVTEDADTEPEETRRARQAAADRFAQTDWTGALDVLPTRLTYERTLVHALSEGQSFREALETLPRQLQQLFVHAAQSYLFNRILSTRLAEGLPFNKPVVGDVVCFADRDAPDDLTVPDPTRTQRVTADRLDTIKRHCARGRAFVTAPLVGTETTLGDGQPGEIERAVLAEAGIEPTSFALPGDWASTGTRRAILVPTDLTVAGSPPTFSFSLPKGSYATVLLREYLKESPMQLG